MRPAALGSGLEALPETPRNTLAIQIEGQAKCFGEPVQPSPGRGGVWFE